MLHTDTRQSGPAAGLQGLLPGFADPVAGAQQAFRAALRAMAEPGLVQELSGDWGVPQGMGPALTALLLTLVDNDTPLWLPSGTDPAAPAFLRFHCGCPIVADVAAARFAAVPAGLPAPGLLDCDPGDPAYPDRSCTVLLEVDALGAGPEVILSGPGIATTRTLRVQGLPQGFWAAWRANHKRFPLGVDVILIHGARLCALPRTTAVED
jgi:alpha-D-ribose 1-methylphosphonate 5-triphosphate synthase subunit PhnH